MQRSVCRFLLLCLRPALFNLVLAGLVFAALVPAAPAIAGEVGAGVPAVPWHRLPADDGEAGFRQDRAGFRGLTGLGFVLRQADEGVPWPGLFFRAGDGLWIGAQGSFNPGSGDLGAIAALKLDF